MPSVNKVILVGRLGKDPEIRHTASGLTVANFSLATSESWKGKDGQKQEQTEWHNIVAWKGVADIVQRFLQKGTTVYIEGSLKTSSWDNKEGVKQYKTEINARLVLVFSGGIRKDDQGGGQPQQEQDLDDGIPF